MSGALDERPAAEGGHAASRLRRGLDRLRALVRDRAANVYVTFAIVAPILLVVIGAGIDYSYAENSKRMLQDANDAATLAVSVAVAQNPNTTVAALQVIAQSVLNADFPAMHPTISDFHVCAPVQNDCAAKTGTMASNTVLLATQATAPCTLGALLPMVCTASNNTAQNLTAKTVTVIGFGATIELNVVMDTSASMIVGATQADIAKIEAWTGYTTTSTTCNSHGNNCKTTTTYPNWNAIKPDDPGPAFANGDNPPCAFACHDLGDSTTAADIAKGLTNASAAWPTGAGATTRFAVMVSAATQLLDHVNTTTTSSTVLSKNTYEFNIWSMNTTVATVGGSDITYSAARTAVTTKLAPGLDTYLNSAMSTLATKLGKNGSGTAASPEKFVILVTDGLQSDRDKNWSSPTFAAPIDTTNCTTMKNNGIVVAVLETPYVPLTGQSPAVKPYEKTVASVIYPNGAPASGAADNPPGAKSALSNALYACATTGYYFKATASSDIATGFITLTDKFLSQMSYISK
jgi:Flp pilus assembly protein TadG